MGIFALLLTLIIWLEPPGPGGMADWWAGNLGSAQTDAPTRPTLIRYSVESAVDAPLDDYLVAQMIEASGWPVVFEYDPVNPNLIVSFVGPAYISTHCGPLVDRMRNGCAAGSIGRGWILLNHWQWTHYLPDQRRHIVEHELGHILGLPHWPCNRGEPAPVMSPMHTRMLNGCLLNPTPTAAEVEMLPNRRDQ